jgi:hypothetical protein
MIPASHPVEELSLYLCRDKTVTAYYEIFEHNKAAFHERFRDHAARMMQTCGFDIIAMWETQTEDRVLRLTSYSPRDLQ